jgi:hypothetical protein
MTLHWTATAYQLRLVISEFGCDRVFFIEYLAAQLPLPAERCQQLHCTIDTDHGCCFETSLSALSTSSQSYLGLSKLN